MPLSFATIYYKTVASVPIYDFIPIYAVIGMYQKEKNIFYSLDGRIYQNIRVCKNRCGFENVISIKDWVKTTKLHKKIKEDFKDYAKTFQKVYFVYLKEQDLMIRYHKTMLGQKQGHFL